MAFTPTRDSGAYASKGGGIIKIHEVTDTGAELASPDGYHDLGFLNSSGFEDTTPQTGVFDEAGSQYATEEGDRAINITGVFGQRQKALLDIAKQTRGKFYLLYKHQGNVDGKAQEVFAFVKITPQFNIGLPGGTMPFEAKAIKNTAAITISTASLAATGTLGWSAVGTATVTIAAVNTTGSTGYYEIIETTI